MSDGFHTLNRGPQPTQSARGGELQFLTAVPSR